MSPAAGNEAAKVERRAATPIAGAIGGILFAVLFGASVMIMTTTMADLAQDTGAWLETGAGRFKFALGLLPFAGLFFLWFIAVARERLGRFEDQFFAAAASAGAIVASHARDPSGSPRAARTSTPDRWSRRSSTSTPCGWPPSSSSACTSSSRILPGVDRPQGTTHVWRTRRSKCDSAARRPRPF